MSATKVPIVIRLADATSISYSSPSFLEGDADNRFFWPPALSTHEEALFARQGDYWTIRYQGCVAFLKATRGLQCLSLLLQNPGREFHVSELLEQVTGKPRVTTANGNVSRACRGRLAPDTGPILDAQAKSEYKLGLEDLRADLKDAERFCDLGRAEQARREIDALAQQLASAVGLGGRDRKSGSEAERARCAVTKRIKESINKIGQTIPSLRRHLATQIKTGYFCSYNLHAEHRVAWAFQSFLTLLFLAYKVTL